MMAGHAKRAQAHVGNGGPFRQGINVGGTQLVRVGGIMWIMTRRTSDRLVKGVGE